MQACFQDCFYSVNIFLSITPGLEWWSSFLWDSMISQSLQNSVDPNMEAGKNKWKCTENPQNPRKKSREWTWNVYWSFHERFAAYVVLSSLCNPKRIGHHKRGYDSKGIIYKRTGISMMCTLENLAWLQKYWWFGKDTFFQFETMLGSSSGGVSFTPREV